MKNIPWKKIVLPLETRRYAFVVCVVCGVPVIIILNPWMIVAVAPVIVSCIEPLHSSKRYCGIRLLNGNNLTVTLRKNLALFCACQSFPRLRGMEYRNETNIETKKVLLSFF
jgi:hypothetical protein